MIINNENSDSIRIKKDTSQSNSIQKNEDSTPLTDQAQSAGPPGSAGMVGSKRWLKAQMGNIIKESENQ